MYEIIMNDGYQLCTEETTIKAEQEPCLEVGLNDRRDERNHGLCWERILQAGEQAGVHDLTGRNRKARQHVS